MSSEAESDLCFSVLNRLLERCAQYRLETKLLASFTQIRFEILSKTQFRTENIETIVECFSCEFGRFALSKLGWLSKVELENGRTTSDFPFSVVFVYTKNIIESSFLKLIMTF